MLNRLRSALYLLALIVTVTPWAFVVCGAALFVGKPKRYFLAQCWTRAAIYLARVLCGIRYQVQGWHNLPDGPAIILCKHQSAWETLWLPSFMPRRLSFVYKRVLNYLPFFGWGMATLGMINIDRSRGQDAFEQIVTQGSEHLKRGEWIALFPEGTRTAPGTRGRYKTGGIRLAMRTGTPIVPIAVNSGECWPRNAFVKTPGLITVSILPALKPSGMSVEAMTNAVQSAIETEMQRLAPHRYPKPART